MANAGWRPTAENYLGRVPKARILEAVREAKGEPAAQLMGHLKKADMAREAERMLADTGWLPEILRPRDPSIDGDANGQETAAADVADITDLPAFLADDAEASNELAAVALDAEESSGFAAAAECRPRPGGFSRPADSRPLLSQ